MIQVMGECDAVLAELRNSFGVEVFGAIGFCWGGLHATLLNGMHFDPSAKDSRTPL